MHVCLPQIFRQYFCQVLLQVVFLSGFALGSISVRFCSRQYFCRVLLQVVFLSGLSLGSISVRFCSRQYFCRVLLQVVFLSGFALGSISVRFYFMQYLYTRSPKGEGGILFYLCPSVRPSKIFFVAFISATIDGRNLIFGHKLHIGTPYRGKRFLTRQIPTSCLPKSRDIIGEHQLTVHLVFGYFI